MPSCNVSAPSVWVFASLRMGSFSTCLSIEEIDSTYTELAKQIGQRKLAYVHVMNQSGFSRLDNVIETEGESGFNGLLRKMKVHLSQYCAHSGRRNDARTRRADDRKQSY